MHIRRSGKRMLVAAVAIAGLASFATDTDASSQDEFRWSGHVAAGSTVEIRGINGGIDAQPSTDGQVSVVALKKGKRSDPADVRIDVVEHGGGVTVCAVYPSPDGRVNECKPGGGNMSSRDNDVEVQFSVNVPSGVVLEAHNVNGGIRVKGLSSLVRAKTVNGGISIETSGTCQAETVNGGINASLGQVATAEDGLVFKTVNGGITLVLPADANARLEASTVNGSIETQFPLTVQGKIGKRHLEGTIGTGGPRLVAKTVNGGIHLNKQ